MAILNRYSGTWNPGSVKHSVVALDMETAARILKEENTEDPAILQCVEEGIFVEIPPANVPCVTSVLPVEAASAGAKATPSVFTFVAGDSAVFEAIEVEGWLFDHWEINEVPVGTERIAEIEIPTTVTVPLEITAVFTTL
jgi:hypothetical protein